MSTYYCSAAGNDSNPGTILSPFLTMAHAISVAVANDTILLRGGDTFGYSTTTSFAGGLTVSSYGTGKATLDGGNHTGHGLNISMTATTDVVSVTNLIFTATYTPYTNGTRYNGCVVSTPGAVNASAGVTISGIDMSGYDTGIAVVCNAAGRINNVAISGNTVHDCQLIGILVQGSTTSAINISNLSVDNNTVHDITGSSVQATSVFGGYAILVISCLTDVGPCVIHDNLCYEIAKNSPNHSLSGVGQGDVIWCQACDGLVIRNNVVHHAYRNTGQDGAAFDLDQFTTNCVVEYNVSHDCQGAAMVTFTDTGQGSGNVFRFNLSINDATGSAGGALRFSGATDGAGSCIVHNCTFIVLSGNPGISSDWTPASLPNKKIYNCIFHCVGGPAMILPALGAGSALDYNYYSGQPFNATYNGTTYSSITVYKAAIGQESHSLASGGSPFVGPISSGTIPAITPGTISLDTPYWLTSGSGPQGTGGDLLSRFSIDPGTSDLNGNPIPVPYSRGAINPAYVAPSARSGSGVALMMGF